jgi:hypothetical protein
MMAMVRASVPGVVHASSRRPDLTPRHERRAARIGTRGFEGIRGQVPSPPSTDPLRQSNCFRLGSDSVRLGQPGLSRSNSATAPAPDLR